MRLALLLLVAPMLGPATVQAQSAFVEYRSVAPLQPQQLRERGKLLIYSDAGQVAVFSAFRRTWLTIAVANAPSIWHANDIALVQDGNVWTAISAYRLAAAPRVFSSQAVVLNPGAQRNDSIVLVQDGAELHAFCAFSGRWWQRRVGTSFAFAVQRHAAVVATPSELLGLSAFAGDWLAQPLSGQAQHLAADGTLAVAEHAGRLWGFSAQVRTWQSSPAPRGPLTRHVASDVAVWSDAAQLVAFSGTRGLFAPAQLPGLRRVEIDEQLAIAESAGLVLGFSAPRAAWSAPIASVAQRQTLGMALAVRSEAQRVLAFSGLRGNWAALPVTAASESVAAAVAEVRDAAGASWFYGAATGAWQAAPAGAVPGAAQLAFASALVPVIGGVQLFSGRSGRYVFLPAAQPSPHLNAGSSVLAVQDAARLHVFDPRRERWVSTGLRSSAPVRVQFWRTSLLAEDGTELIGFGAQDGVLRRHGPSFPLRSVGTSSEAGRGEGSAGLVGFSPLGRLLAFAQFPEFRRVHAAGTPLRLALAGSAGEFAVLVLGLPAAELAVPPLGVLELGPATLIAGPVLALDASGYLDFELTLPRTLTLGLEPSCQALRWDPALTSVELTGPARVMGF